MKQERAPFPGTSTTRRYEALETQIRSPQTASVRHPAGVLGVLSVTDQPDVKVRTARAGDQAYVASTWLRSLTNGRPSARDDELRTTIDRVLDHKATRILVACERKQEAKLYGWLAHVPLESRALVHYLYVREPLRGRGIARALADRAELLTGKPLVYTMRGPAATPLLLKFPAVHMKLDEVLV